jgi:hypothetical protein
LDFEFVHKLKSGSWTKLPKDWLSNIKKKLQTAMDSSIKSIKLVWILGTPNLLPGNDKVTNQASIDRRFIYEIYMEKTFFHVYYGQIVDIVGDEPWIKSEVQCLCNIAS